jgi:hypothetical protein
MVDEATQDFQEVRHGNRELEISDGPVPPCRIQWQPSWFQPPPSGQLAKAFDFHLARIAAGGRFHVEFRLVVGCFETTIQNIQTHLTLLRHDGAAGQKIGDFRLVRFNDLIAMPFTSHLTMMDRIPLGS